MLLTIQLAFLMLLLAAAPGPAQSDPSGKSPGRRIYEENCARCHGPEGRGDGPTKIFPPARNFRAGGFSFGYTPEAVFRTVSHGIPGTAMTPFDGSLSAEDRKHVVEYVLTLVPKKVREPPRAARVVVTDRARIVRGYLPSRVAGRDNWPRGLALGLPGGFGMFFRYDDLRLLEIRRGPFVERADWRGRGGSPLRLLGRDWLVFGRGDPRPPFEVLDPLGPHPLRSVGRATSEDGPRARLEYELRRGRRPVAAVVEHLRVAPVRGATGIARRTVLRGGAVPVTLLFRACPEIAGAHWRGVTDVTWRRAGSLQLGEVEEFPCWGVATLGPGRALAIQVTAPDEARLVRGPGFQLRIELPARSRVEVLSALLTLPRWTDDARLTLESDLETAW